MNNPFVPSCNITSQQEYGMSETSNKKVRITLTLKEEDALKIEEASEKLGIPKTYYIISATLEKIKKEENKSNYLKQEE